jgi:hypothetical protein
LPRSLKKLLLDAFWFVLALVENRAVSTELAMNMLAGIPDRLHELSRRWLDRDMPGPGGCHGQTSGISHNALEN